MHEPELLPPWYPQLLRRRRRFLAQLRLAAALVVILGTQTLVAEHQAEVSANKLLTADAHKTRQICPAQRGDDIALARYELQQHERIEQQAGIRVPASRLLYVLDQMIVSPTALSQLELRTLEPGSPGADQPKMQVRLVGLAPSQEDLIALVTKLMTVPYFGEVAQGLQNQIARRGRSLIHFELTFSLDLSGAATVSTN
jgi:hypothetical protein